MLSRSVWRNLGYNARRRATIPEVPYRCFSCSQRAQADSNKANQDERMTHFGFSNVPESQKESMVGAVFSSVASSYDAMNDFMSLGIHRLWKDHFVRSLNPGSALPSRNTDTTGKGWNILDIAGGTGDIAFRMLDHATNINHDHETRVTIADINPDMLAEGKKRSIQTPYYNTNRLSFMQGNAQHMPNIPDNSVDLYTVVFGIRNFTDKQAALNEAFRVLKPGGVFACMEFSKVENSVFNAVYKQWSFSAIPMIGQLVAGDRESYQYLVESIEKFPSQEEFRGMIQKAVTINHFVPENGFCAMGHLQQQSPMIPLSSPADPSVPTMIKKDRLARDELSLLSLTPPDVIDPILSTAKDGPTDASVSTAIHVIATERAALAHLERLYETNALAQESLARAVSQITHSVRSGGKLVCCGVGKSGKIAQKLEATMNSLGIYSAFLHPTEALHGDLGMIRPQDTLLLISFSGRTPELLLLLPHIPATVPIIAITAHLHPSTCPLLSFQPSDMGILLPAPIHEDEELSIGVSAPTSSTTVALSLGDALAIATARRLHTSSGRGPAEIFKSFHPGGAIGAASNVLTPMSMSTASFPSTTSDDLSSQQQSVASLPQLEETPRIIDKLVPIDQIPTVSTSTGTIRLLDILLTAIQHPTAKSWVHLSPSEIIPPRHLRSLSQTNYVDMDTSALATLGLPFSVSRDDWLRLPSLTSVNDARRLVSESTTTAGSVIAVMQDENPDACLGFFEAEDLWDGCD
ncbi:ubiE/COQ5 methyltransferase family-domain-containing protein [Aspergillus pseudotamarii]|uniref:2-methoxy-6-polyprenyl-1,4-benzoquinol methylase, mitochondrial n=1 Tax=Aspergillus pseudotamarii TaxID=132259 RepID=A0A5N6SFU9_ASPPS|nr:ubiE/COQ5 methyltransferase family-domain-containing protein [Aspergillus pseudotamarii]KAE8132561.1 ubiE/COQ5 methyltransferase family-domain-containing protein [Aspergillus pseudotamarii]